MEVESCSILKRIEPPVTYLSASVPLPLTFSCSILKRIEPPVTYTVTQVAQVVTDLQYPQTDRTPCNYPIRDASDVGYASCSILKRIEPPVTDETRCAIQCLDALQYPQTDRTPCNSGVPCIASDGSNLQYPQTDRTPCNRRGNSHTSMDRASCSILKRIEPPVTLVVLIASPHMRQLAVSSNGSNPL